MASTPTAIGRCDVVDVDRDNDVSRQRRYSAPLDPSCARTLTSTRATTARSRAMNDRRQPEQRRSRQRRDGLCDAGDETETRRRGERHDRAPLNPASAATAMVMAVTTAPSHWPTVRRNTSNDGVDSDSDGHVT